MSTLVIQENKVEVREIENPEATVKNETGYDFLKSGVERIAIAQITTDPGRLQENLKKIVTVIDQAREKGADLVVFPELSVPGYKHMDLASRPVFLEENRKVLDKIVEASSGIGIIVGFLNEDITRKAPDNQPFVHNSAAVIRDGELLGIQDKSLLPNYRVFSESRYYQPGEERKIFQFGDDKVGVAICEDLWSKGYEIDVVEELTQAGADFVVSINASPFSTGKHEIRKELIGNLAAEHSTSIIYANLIGSFDGGNEEVVFDGRSMVFNSEGIQVAEGVAFEEELLLFDRNTNTPTDAIQMEEIHELHDALVLGIKDFYRRKPTFSKALIGISGGIDSAVTAALAVEALGAENVIGITMPSHITSNDTKSDAHLLAQALGFECKEISIENSYNAWVKSFMKLEGCEPNSLARQNAQSRIRGDILMNYSNYLDGTLVLTTGNKTEVATGYCTLYGDTCGAHGPLGDVDKLDVYELAKFKNRIAGKELIPETTITRPPSAELEEDQADADNLPEDYDVLSPLVREIIQGELTESELMEKYPADVTRKTLSLVDKNEFKRRQMPPVIRVTNLAFGIERRVPMDSNYREGELS